jgi:haloalkane dehalogenase
MIELMDAFGGAFPFEPHVTTAPGFAMHYVDEGKGAPILLLHGEPSWSYLYRDIIPRLAARHRVLAPDMKGFGKSETPDDGRYSPEDQIAALEAFVLALDLRDITLVAHDWGGRIGSVVALAHPDRVARLVVMNAALALGHPDEGRLLSQAIPRARYFQWMGSLYKRGVMETVLGEFGTLIPTVMRDLQGIVTPRAADPEWVRAYASPFATPPECAGAIALPRSIVAGAAFASPDPEAAKAIAAKPAMMIYGMQDRVLLPDYFIKIFERQFPEAPVYRLENAGHFLQEDEPEAIAHLIDMFVRFT